MYGWYDIGLKDGDDLAVSDIDFVLLCAGTDGRIDFLLGHFAPEVIGVTDLQFAAHDIVS